MLQLQINQMKGYWYDKVQVAIFLCSDGSTAPGCATGPATAEQQDILRSLLESPAVSPYINDFQYESQDDAYRHFKDQFSNSPIVDAVTPDQLPASFRINMKDPEKYQIISETFSSQTGVETVVDQRQLLRVYPHAANDRQIKGRNAFAALLQGFLVGIGREGTQHTLQTGEQRTVLFIGLQAVHENLLRLFQIILPRIQRGEVQVRLYNVLFVAD